MLNIIMIIFTITNMLWSIAHIQIEERGYAILRGYAISDGERGYAISNKERGDAISDGERGDAISDGERGYAIYAVYETPIITSNTKSNTMLTSENPAGGVFYINNNPWSITLCENTNVFGNPYGLGDVLYIVSKGETVLVRERSSNNDGWLMIAQARWILPQECGGL